MKDNRYCIGVDYGSDSVRSIIVDATDGKELASSVFAYPRWQKGLYCDITSSRFRQHPKDYIEGLLSTVKDCVAQVGTHIASQICAMAIDTTGSTPVAVNKQGVPLSLLPEFEEDPDAMFILWKDHTAIKEMGQINDHAKKFDVDYLKYCGGIYSSEWFWSKILHTMRKNNRVANACYTWVEHCDWMPFLLTGGTDASQIKRSVCAAGHKCLFADEWNGFPPDDFFASLDSVLAGLVETLPRKVYTADTAAGTLSAEWANRLGLSEEVIVTVGALDAHIGTVGGQIEPYYLSMVMGTSTCDMLVVPSADMTNGLVSGICGSVNGSIIPGMIGMEAGQSAFGDVYAWFKRLLEWSLNIGSSANLTPEMIEAQSSRIMSELNIQAAQLTVGADDVLSIDWFNGRRTPDADQSVQGAITGLTLGSSAPHIFRSLVESTCFGARAIVERFQEYKIPIKGVIALGGIAQKSPFVMQTMADVLNMPIRVNSSVQTCALGAAMFAATAAGVYPSVEDAMRHMGRGFSITYTPNKQTTAIYDRRYLRYLKIGKQIAESQQIKQPE